MDKRISHPEQSLRQASQLNAPMHNAPQLNAPLPNIHQLKAPEPNAAQRVTQCLKSLRVLRVTSQALFAGAQEIEITHQGAQYRLRQTSLGKLILTK